MSTGTRSLTFRNIVVPSIFGVKQAKKKTLLALYMHKDVNL